ncbi:hypothetical protein QFC24_003533 [Naganishia onofrii]|uniref:Uncharacterized protein n=1 Tax=Naganishia onofrii TaxID=1851511 RepID=A0ACC2XI94_9TREE|nr:hypothetical protein QFC24_003533 [Naganishia onofrii]
MTVTATSPVPLASSGSDINLGGNCAFFPMHPRSPQHVDRNAKNTNGTWRESWPPLVDKRRYALESDALPQQGITSVPAKDTGHASRDLSIVFKRLTNAAETFASCLERFTESLPTTVENVEEYLKRSPSVETGEISPLPLQIERKPKQSGSNAERDKQAEVGPEEPPKSPLVNVQDPLPNTPTPRAGNSTSSPLTPEAISQEYLDREMNGMPMTPNHRPPPPPAPHPKTTPVPIVASSPQVVVANRPDMNAALPSPSSSMGNAHVNTPTSSALRSIATLPLSVETKPASVAPSPAPAVIVNNIAPKATEAPVASPHTPQTGDTPDQSPVDKAQTPQPAPPQSRPGSPAQSIAPSSSASGLTADNLEKHNSLVERETTPGSVQSKDDDVQSKAGSDSSRISKASTTITVPDRK